MALPPDPLTRPVFKASLKEDKVIMTIDTHSIEKLIKDFVASPANSLHMEVDEPAWAEPLVGFSSGADPLYRGFKESIGEFFWEPVEIFRKTFPDVDADSSTLTVISWVLPQTKATREANRLERDLPSERWARSRKFGEEFNVLLRRHVVSELSSIGIKAIAPQLSPHWAMYQSERFGHSSAWSERHAAYAAGLGTFGLCDGLITARGKAMRCGSVVANITLPPTKRPYSHHRQYCPFFSKGTCGACIKRCPAGALSEKGHDKELCRVYVEETTARHIEKTWGLQNTYGCGLCQTKVPCESSIPDL